MDLFYCILRLKVRMHISVDKHKNLDSALIY